MSDKARRGGAGAPFYAPPRRKTSAEIISEARAAVYGETNTSSTAAAAGALRPLRTRRPFTPREPQRTLFGDRARKKEPRPPSAFNLQYLSLSEDSEEVATVPTDAAASSFDEGILRKVLAADAQNNVRKKNATQLRAPSRPTPGDEWSIFAKLPHLSGSSKPLHKRSAHQSTEDSRSDSDLGNIISVTGPLVSGRETLSAGGEDTKSPSPEVISKRKQYTTSKSQSYEHNRRRRGSDGGISRAESQGSDGGGVLGDVPVRRIAVTVPNANHGSYDSMSILEISEQLSDRNCDGEQVVRLVESLLVARRRLAPGASLRDLLLRSLYTHIDSDDDRVLVALARALFTLQVTGGHLTTACKLAFKIAKNDKNDHFFRTTNLLELSVEGCGRAAAGGEAALYAAGALRLAALDAALRTRARAAGAAHLLALHLQIINHAKSENPRGSDQWSNALYQLTGALRNLATDAGAGGSGSEDFVSSGALRELIAALGLHQTDRDVLTNVVRCLSVLSAEEECCAWLCSSSSAAAALVACLGAVAARAALAVRLAYTLGNMAAVDDQARLNIFNEEGAMDVLLIVLESYSRRRDRNDVREEDQDPDWHLIGSDLEGSDGSNEDVLIKTARVIANLCLSQRVGASLAECHGERTVRALLACLQLAETCRDTAPTDLDDEAKEDAMSRREELATAILATLNNVTFYMEPPDVPDLLPGLMEPLCKATCRWVCAGAGVSQTAACEAVRALGNLSRCRRAAALLALAGAVEALAPFLTHQEASVRCSAAGVLVNVCGAGGGGCGAAAAAAGPALAAAAAAGDAECGALLARALWNAAAHRPLPAQLARLAQRALHRFIDDESVFAECEAAKHTDRRASDPSLFKHKVIFEDDEQEEFPSNQPDLLQRLGRARSVDYQLSYDGHDDADVDEVCPGEEAECWCAPCRRLAAWERLLAVAVPLLELLRARTTDAAVGTD